MPQAPERARLPFFVVQPDQLTHFDGDDARTRLTALFFTSVLKPFAWGVGLAVGWGIVGVIRSLL